MSAKCILCQSNPPIENSHIVPKFVIKRLRAGSPLQTLIHSDALGQVFQDGWKKPYLCLTCENQFSKWEGWFCTTVYDPFLSKGKVKFSYREVFGLFAASLAFRYIYFLEEKNPTKPLSPGLISIRENLRSALLARSLSSISSASYMEFLFPVTTIDRFPPGINTYFFEAIDGKAFDYVVPENDTLWILYMKLPGMYFVLSERGLEQYMKINGALASSKISDQGTMDSSDVPGGLSLWVADIFTEVSLALQVNYSLLPTRRADQISKNLAGSPDKETTRAHQSYLLDKHLITLLGTASSLPSVKDPSGRGLTWPFNRMKL